MDMFLESSQNWNILGGHFYTFYALFLRSKYRMGLFWGVAKISNIFVMPHIPDIYLQFIMVKQLMLSPSLRSKKMRVHIPSSGHRR